MIIGIDYRFAVKSIRGIGYHVKSVVSALSKIDSSNTYLLYVDEPLQPDLGPNFKTIHIDQKNLIIFEQRDLPARARKDEVDVLWYPSNSGPVFLAKNIKLVVTIHDLVSFNYKLSPADFKSFKSLKSLLAEKYRALALRFGLNRITEIVTVSEFTATEIQMQLGKNATVIVNHVSRLKQTTSGAEVLTRLNLSPKNYIYTMTGIGKHKNLKGYINLFRSGEMQQPLVISGITDKNVIDRYRGDFIIFTNQITEAEKASLYANASAFLLLSYHEGFGLPILEAMQFNIPIVAADRGALPMVLGHAGKLVDPDDYKQIKENLESVIGKVSEAMKQQQQDQYAKFSDWSISAKAYLHLFLSIGEPK